MITLRLAVLAALALLVGCAVQTAPGGKLQFGLDNAELLGQTLASFKLADGSEGRLRVLGGQYSVKLQKQLKVVDIPNATMARVLSADTVGGRTLVVLEKSERNCNYKTQLLSIQGAEVLMWDFGDCNTKPVAAISPEQALFDFVQPQRTIRFTYRDSRLMRGEYPTQPADPLGGAAALSGAPVDANARRYVPGPPVAALPASAPKAADSSGAKAPAKAAPASSLALARSTTAAATPATTAAPAPRPAPPAAAKALDFPAQEQKPVRIVLDK